MKRIAGPLCASLTVLLAGCSLLLSITELSCAAESDGVCSNDLLDSVVLIQSRDQLHLFRPTLI
jgi:hypothetical protein